MEDLGLVDWWRQYDMNGWLKDLLVHYGSYILLFDLSQPLGSFRVFQSMSNEAVR